MEQGNWNVDEMLHWLDMKINREDRNIREQSKKMNENFLHFFEWNAESLYKSHFMSGCYKILRHQGPPFTPSMGMVYRVHNYSSYYRTLT